MKIERYSNKCPICGGKIKFWPYFKNYFLYLLLFLPFSLLGRKCSRCGVKLRAKPPIVFWLVLLLCLPLFAALSLSTSWLFILAFI